MKRILIIASALAAFTALPAQAQDAISGSASQSINSANQISASGAIAAGGAGGQVVMPQPLARQTVVQEGTAELRTAPSLGGLALGGGHPCAYAPATFQVSVIGGGAGGGGMKVDSACMLLIMASAASDPKAYAAGSYMIAARDRDACVAMLQAGMVSDCVDKEGRSFVRPRAKAAAPVTNTRPKARTNVVKAGYSKCELGAGNTVTIRYMNGANKPLAKANCLRSLGF